MMGHEYPRPDRDGWRDHAACRPGTGVDPAIFFPGVGQTTAHAKAICATCPVRLDCLEHALAQPPSEDRCGIFGGTTEEQRRAIRRQRGITRPRSERQHGTEAGYRQHRRNDEDACAACREAHRIATYTGERKAAS